MKTRYIAIASLSLSLGFAFNSCTCDDVIAEETQWNKIVLSPSLAGQVNTIGNKPLANAVVTVVIDGKEFKKTTDAQGRYVINDLKAGVYEVSASYPSDPNYVSSTSKVLLEDNATTNWNALLYAVSTNATVSDTNDGALYTIELPDVVNTETSTSQVATYNVPEGAMVPNDKLLLSTHYDIQESNSSRAAYSYSGSDIVVVCDSKTALGASSLKKPISISAYSLCKPSAVYHNGKQVKVEYAESENGLYCYFETTELGNTEFLYPINISETEVTVQQITFDQREFEGKANHISTKYHYKNGVDVTLSNTYLDQYVLLLQGNLAAQDCVGVIDMDLDIPAGERVVVSAEQAVSSFSYACGDVTVPVVRYGKVYTKVSDRQHTGGSSK